MSRLESLEAALQKKTALVLLESPSNPLLDVLDLSAAIALARRAGARTLVDNTFATPVLQRPLDMGADVVLHSTTKYLGGHSDVQGGALVFREREPFYEKVDHVRHVLGAVGSPFNSWLVLRGHPHPRLSAWPPTAPTPWRWRGPSSGTPRWAPSTTRGLPPIPATRWPAARCPRSGP